MENSLGGEAGGRRARVPAYGSLPLRLALLALLSLLVSARWTLAQHLQTLTFGAASGLANLNVETLLEDHSGLIWVGTESGVYVADGQSFQKQMAFTEAGIELIQALREDARGRIWALDRSHLVFWDGRAIHRIDVPQLSQNADAASDLIVLPGEPDAAFLLRGGNLRRIASSDAGHTWTTSAALTPELLARHPEWSKLHSAAAAGRSALWAGCGRQLCRFELTRGTAEVFDDQRGVPSEAWNAMLVARDGTVWARSEKTLVRRPPGAACFETVPSPPGGQLQTESPVIVENADGGIVLNIGDAIATFFKGRWTVFDHRNGLPEAQVSTLLFDRSGELWLGPEGLGLVRFPGYGVWEGWTKAEGLKTNVIWSMARSRDGTLWGLSQQGLERMPAGAHGFTEAQSSLPLSRLKAVALDARDHLWLGDSQGRVIDYDPQSGKARIAASGLGRVIRLMTDRRQRVWVGSQEGPRVFSADDNWSSAHPLDARALPQGYAWDLAEGPGGEIWLSNGKGLFRLDGDAWTAIALPFPGGSEYNFMIAPAQDGTLWAQSKQPFPVLRLRVRGNRAEIVERVAGASFGSDNITFLNTDHRGWLWVGSDDGLHVYDGQRWVHATSEDGLLWNDTDFHAFMEDPDGSIWVGTSAGLAHLLRPEQLFALQEPSFRIREAKVGEEPLRGNNPSFDLRRPVLTIHLLSTSYARGSATVYHYRLDGQEGEWQEKRGSYLRFPALDAGPYKLSIEAYDTRLHLTSAPVTLPFTVLEPWWARRWFRWTEAVLGLLLGFALWRLSVRLLVRRQQVLERLVASRTRELEREKAELLSTRSALLEMTRRDSLTGLLNRAAIFAEMSALCQASLESGRPLALAMADLDLFKRINDQYGHVTGDTVLRECARRIEQALRAGDAVGRYGGEELLILMPGLYPASAMARMEQLRLAVAGAPVMQGDAVFTVTCSFGVAWLDGDRCSVESLVERADAALYRAKQNGRNRVEFALQLPAGGQTPVVPDTAGMVKF